MENLRYMLYQYHSQTSLYIGCRFAIKHKNTEEGFMAGGGHIFSKKALIKFNEIALHNASLCVQEDSSLDDVFVGGFSKKAIYESSFVTKINPINNPN